MTEPDTNATNAPPVESTTETSTVATVPETAPAAPELPPLVGADGKLHAEWRNRIPEELRKEKCLDVIGDDFNLLVKNYVYNKKMVGMDKVVLPTDKSPQAVWDEFYAATGRPKAAADYKFERAKDVPEELWSKDQADSFKQVAWKIGLTGKQMEVISQFENQRALDMGKTLQATQDAERTTAESALRTEWGDAYEEKMHLANAFIAKTTAEGNERSEILELAGNNPVFIKWVSMWGGKTAESAGLDTAQLKRTPSDLIQRDRELLTKEFTSGELKKNDPYRHEQIMRERNEIAQQLSAQSRKTRIA